MSSIHELVDNPALEQAPVALAVYDTEQQWVWGNRSYRAATATAQDAIGPRPCHAPWGFASPCRDCAVAQVLQTGEDAEVERVVEHGRGAPRTVQFNAAPLRADDGTIIGVIETIRDITESQQTVNSLQQEIALLNKARDTSPALFLLLNAEGQILSMNATLLTTLGLTHSEAIGQDFIDTCVPEPDRAQLRQVLAHNRQTDGQSRLISRILKKDVSLRTVEWQLSFVSDRFDEESVFLAIGLDITQRQAEENALRRLQHDQQMILDHVPTLMFMKDTHNNIIRVTESVARSTGLPRDQIEGRHSSEVYPDMADSYFDADREVMRTGQPKLGIVEPLPASDGTTRWLLTDKVPYHDEAGSVTGIFVFSTDITAFKEAESALIENERRMKTLFGNLPGMAYRCKNTANWTMEFLSEGCREVTGYEPEDLLNDNVLSYNDIIHPDDRVILWNTIKEILDDTQAFEFEYRIITKNNETRWVWERGRMVTLPDRNEQVLEGFITDITARKHAEEERNRLQEQLQQAQKLEAIGRLAGGVAHDFNNMLGVILLQAELAQRQVPPDQPRLHSRIGEIISAAKRSSGITQQLLAFARKQRVAPRTLDVNDTIAGMLKMLRRLIGKHIELEWHPGTAVWPIKLDPSQMDQILANLCVNARDAIRDAGTVKVETNNVTFDETYCANHADVMPGSFVQITVSDNGVGIDETIRSRIFEPFFTTKGVNEGTGLGLATVYGIVKQNDGFINVYSEPGLGTTFRLYLPAQLQPNHERPQPTTQTLPHGRGEAILLVEDETAILDATATALTNLGYNVLSAATPGEALQLARTYRGRIQLVITDMTMPEMNGRELADQLLAHHPEMQLLFISGHTPGMLAAQSRLDENARFVQKPFSVETLAVEVQAALDTV